VETEYVRPSTLICNTAHFLSYLSGCFFQGKNG
jgi:hypothetical protein